MRRITPAQGLQDLQAWMNARGSVFDTVRQLNGGGGWEQWSVIDFLTWQLAYRAQLPISYQREFRVDGLRRAFDIAYNVPPDIDGPLTRDQPLILTQWKCLNDSNAASMGATQDIGTLTEARQTILPGFFWLPVLVILCPGQVAFPGVQSQQIPGTQVRLHASSPDTWRHYGW